MSKCRKEGKLGKSSSISSRIAAFSNVFSRHKSSDPHHEPMTGKVSSNKGKDSHRTGDLEKVVNISRSSSFPSSTVSQISRPSSSHSDGSLSSSVFSSPEVMDSSEFANKLVWPTMGRRRVANAMPSVQDQQQIRAHRVFRACNRLEQELDLRASTSAGGGHHTSGASNAMNQKEEPWQQRCLRRHQERLKGLTKPRGGTRDAALGDEQGKAWRPSSCCDGSSISGMDAHRKKQSTSAFQWLERRKERDQRRRMCVLIAPSEEDEEEDDDDDDSEAWAHDCEALMDAYRKRTNSIQ
eukprot:1343175-Rhodomonas_salina.1